MLGHDDHRRLSQIEAEIAASDPGFAQGLRDGTPRPPRDDRRWPYIAGALAALVILLLGIALTAPVVIAIGAVGLAATGIRYRHHLRRAQGGTRRTRRRHR